MTDPNKANKIDIIVDTEYDKSEWKDKMVRFDEDSIDDEDRESQRSEEGDNDGYAEEIEEKDR